MVLFTQESGPAEVAQVGAFDKYIQHQRSEVDRNTAAAQTRRRAAQEAATRLAELLAAEFGVERVYVFGSVLTDRFGPHSDIDLACMGLRPELFFTAWARINDASAFRVDLISLETVPAELRARVLAEGVMLFDRGGGSSR